MPEQRVQPQAQRQDEQDPWREFAQAATPQQFYRSWLAIQCRMIPGTGAAVVLTGKPGTGPYGPAAVWPDDSTDILPLAQVAEKALAQRRGLVLRRPAETGPGGPSAERLHVAFPITLDGKLSGIVALDLSPRPEAGLQEALRQLEWGSGWLELIQRRSVAVDGGARERLQAVLDLVASALGQERFFAEATAFVTTLATRLGCERVSIGFLARDRARVRAVSHSANLGKQTNLLRAIAAAMDEAMAQQAALVHPAPAGGEARITRAHEQLGRDHGAGTICTVPFAEGTRMIGALTLERAADRPFDASTVELCEAVAALAGPTLELRRRDDRWLVVKAAGAGRRQLAHLVGPRHVALKLGVATVLALAALLGFARGDYRVSAPTVMEAGVKRAAVAPFNGYIKEASVRAGDAVRRGQVLAVLEDRELRLERAKVQSQQEQLIKQHSQALASRNAAGVNIAAAQIDQARAQAALLAEQLEDGYFHHAGRADDVIISAGYTIGAQEIEDALRRHPYVADVAVGQRGALMLAASPSDPIGLTVEKITPVSTAREGRNYFRVEARLDRTPDRLRPGLEGIGKIDVDRRRLVWIWLRPVVDWVRLTLWKWLP